MIAFNRSPLSERHVQALWYDGDLRPQKLRTIDGLDIRIIYPGIWNLEAGPDFRDAVIEVGHEGRRIRGDIEIHLRPGDWTSHGHKSDPAYRNVIAHVTWYSGPPPTELPFGCLSICLGDFLRTRADFSPDEIDLGAYPYARIPTTKRPCEELFANNLDLFLEVLRLTGIRRIAGKARRLKALFVRNGDHPQTFYEEMMAAFGYKHNSASFRALAETIRWIDLPTTTDSAEMVLRCVAEMDVANRIPWRTANVRPVNSPQNRIICAASLFAGKLPEILLALTGCDLLSEDGLRIALKMLQENGHLGANRAASMITNVVVPFALAEERIDTVPKWLPPEGICSPVRLTAFRLLGRDHNPAMYSTNGLLTQGLIQIHREFCLAVHPDCSNCSLVSWLNEQRS